MALQLRDDPIMTGLSVLLLPVAVIVYRIRKHVLKNKNIDLDDEFKKIMSK